MTPGDVNDGCAALSVVLVIIFIAGVVETIQMAFGW